MFTLLVLLEVFSLSLAKPPQVGGGLLLLYRPKDVTVDCMQSSFLRYDVSFGMGLSDTITLLFRAPKKTKDDYECVVEIGNPNMATLIFVILYPIPVRLSCDENEDLFKFYKSATDCDRICDMFMQWDVEDSNSNYMVTISTSIVRFSFATNGSVSQGTKPQFYQVTVTAARELPISQKCSTTRNETFCNIHNKKYCFTNGAMCDGIKNCGESDWYDEKKAECTEVTETLRIAPVIAVAAVIFCACLAVSHLMARCLPPVTSSFFIFNADEDNRLCIEPVLAATGNPKTDEVFDNDDDFSVSSSTLSTEEFKPSNEMNRLTLTLSTGLNELPPEAAMKKKSMGEKLQNKLMDVIKTNK